MINIHLMDSRRVFCKHTKEGPQQQTKINLETNNGTGDEKQEICVRLLHSGPVTTETYSHKVGVDVIWTHNIRVSALQDDTCFIDWWGRTETSMVNVNIIKMHINW